MAVCAAPHPEHEQVTCIDPEGHTTADHIGHLNGEPISWEVEGWKPMVRTGGKSKGEAAQHLIDLVNGVPKPGGTRTLPGTQTGTGPGDERRPVDANVVTIGGGHPETSIEMGERILPKTGTQRRQVYDLALSRGEHGVTDDEIEIALEMLHQSASAARNGLMNDGWLVDTGLRRPTRRGFNAIAWVAVSS